MKYEVRMRVVGAFRQSQRSRLLRPLPPTPEQVLADRAQRILTDGMQHSHQAVLWACTVTGTALYQQPADVELVLSGDYRPTVFSLRELSLGADQ